MIPPRRQQSRWVVLFGPSLAMVCVCVCGGIKDNCDSDSQKSNFCFIDSPPHWLSHFPDFSEFP